MPLTPRIQAAIQILFRPEEQAQVAELLDRDCGAGLPLMGVGKEDEVERVQLAVLKCGKGTLEGTLNAVVLAQKDWRDVLVAAGFGGDAAAHLGWDPKEINLAKAKETYMWYECDNYMIWHEEGGGEYARLGASFEDESKWDKEWLSEHPGRKLPAEERRAFVQASQQVGLQMTPRGCVPSTPKYVVQPVADKTLQDGAVLNTSETDKSIPPSSSPRLPGFRLSFRDALVLATATGLYFLAHAFLPAFAWLIPFVVAHFFFFCNMLRPGTKLELIWAGCFVAQLVGWAVWKGELAPLLVIAVQMPVTLVVTIITLRSSDYHGVLWRKINPNWKDLP